MAFVGAIMLADLSLIVTTMSNNSTVLSPDEKTQVAQVLEQDAQVMSKSQLAGLTSGQSAATQTEILRIKRGARPVALQLALVIPILAGLIGLVVSLRIGRQPDPKQGVSPEATGFG